MYHQQRDRKHAWRAVLVTPLETEGPNQGKPATKHPMHEHTGQAVLPTPIEVWITVVFPSTMLILAAPRKDIASASPSDVACVQNGPQVLGHRFCRPVAHSARADRLRLEHQLAQPQPFWSLWGSARTCRLAAAFLFHLHGLSVRLHLRPVQCTAGTAA